MRLSGLLLALAAVASGTILQNGQVRTVDYPNTAIADVVGQPGWRHYPAKASEISYKGRWDSKHISWWSAPGLKFGFTGDKIAISFGNWTSDGVLLAYRLDGQDWLFTNVTSSTTHLLITADTPGFHLSNSGSRTFELRVTNWGYGVQISAVHTADTGSLIQLPNHARTIEFIGDSLSAGMYDSYEGLSSFAWGVGAGFGNVEFGVTAYPGICLVDRSCWGNERDQSWQWFRTSDTSFRAGQIWGDAPEEWDFRSRPAADLVVINLGTNDNNPANNISGEVYYDNYVKLVEEIHGLWPAAQVVLMSLWNGFSARGSSYYETSAFREEIYAVYAHHQTQGFVHYFNTTGIMQHNDIAPQYHPTDVGQIKVASHLMQYINIKFGWEFGATGPEVQHDTLYWNDGK